MKGKRVRPHRQIPESCFLVVCFVLVSSIVFTHSRKAGHVPMKPFDNTDAVTAYSECHRMFPFIFFSCHVSFLVIICTTQSDKSIEVMKLFRISALGDVFVYIIQRKVVPVIWPAYYTYWPVKSRLQWRFLKENFCGNWIGAMQSLFMQIKSEHAIRKIKLFWQREPTHKQTLQCRYRIS